MCSTVMGGNGASSKDWLRARGHHLCLTDTISSFCFFSVGGDICTCYYDTEHGHWDGNATGCVQCFQGWNLPDCKRCASSK